jgi:hypothetical protein
MDATDTTFITGMLPNCSKTEDEAERKQATLLFASNSRDTIHCGTVSDNSATL